MGHDLSSLRAMARAVDLRSHASQAGPACPRWEAAELRGRFIEISASGASSALSQALGLVHAVQARGEPVAWICGTRGTFFPPDAGALGIDLAALPVILAPDAGAAMRTADRLVRSAAFGLLVVDLGADAGVPMPLISRVVRLAREHDSTIVALTAKRPSVASLSSLVGLRGSAGRRRLGKRRYAVRVDVTKDKRRGPGWSHMEDRRGAPGMR